MARSNNVVTPARQRQRAMPTEHPEPKPVRVIDNGGTDEVTTGVIHMGEATTSNEIASLAGRFMGMDNEQAMYYINTYGQKFYKEFRRVCASAVRQARVEEPIPAEPNPDKVVSLLEGVLAEAKTNGLSAVAVAVVKKDGKHIDTFVEADQAYSKLLEATVKLKHRMITGP